MFKKKSAPGDEENQVVEKSTDTLGCYLKGARLSQGLELSEVAAETRIDIKNLVSLEDDNRSALPADVYTRGFIRLYASHLKLDPHEAIRRYEQQWGTNLNFEVAPLKKINPSPSFWPGIIIALTLIATLFGVRFFSGPVLETNSTQEGSSSQAVAPTPAPQPSPSVTAPADAPPLEENASTPDTATQSLSPGTATPPYEIVLSCSHEIPLTITLDSIRTTESVCPPKSPQTWKAEKSFDLTLSTSQGVTLTINGVTVPIPAADEGKSITIHRP